MRTYTEREIIGLLKRLHKQVGLDTLTDVWYLKWLRAWDAAPEFSKPINDVAINDFDYALTSSPETSPEPTPDSQPDTEFGGGSSGGAGASGDWDFQEPDQSNNENY
jgi:hypothetical protein